MYEALYTQYFPESWEKKYRTSVYMGKNQKLIFFIPDANLTSIKSFAVTAAKTEDLNCL